MSAAGQFHPHSSRRIRAAWPWPRPVVAAADLDVEGGADGDDTLSWAVNSRVSGALPLYRLSLLSPQPYTIDPLQCLITPGTIPFALGDQFLIAIEGGHFRWRRDEEAWQPTQEVGAAHDLGDGLTLRFLSGPPPGLVAGDHWRWRITQTFTPLNVKAPVPGRGFEWVGPDAILRADLGVAIDIPAVLIALHTLPITATLMVAGSLDAITWWTEALPIRSGPLALFMEAKTARYLELRITAAPNARLGWWWVGEAWQPTKSANTFRLKRVYGMTHGAGLNHAALYRGRGNAGELIWDPENGSWLEAADRDELLALLDQVKSAGDEPFAVTPHFKRPDETALVIADSDDLVFEDVLRFQCADRRILGVTLPLRAVLE